MSKLSVVEREKEFVGRSLPKGKSNLRPSSLKGNRQSEEPIGIKKVGNVNSEVRVLLFLLSLAMHGMLLCWHALARLREPPPWSLVSHVVRSAHRPKTNSKDSLHHLV